MSKPEAAGLGICYCGHDCSRCMIYEATISDSAALRTQVQEYYQAEFHFAVPLDKIRCSGGCSSEVFYLCRECPWRQCCISKQINSCAECVDYPCAALAVYQAKYVNKCLQINDAG